MKYPASDADHGEDVRIAEDIARHVLDGADHPAVRWSGDRTRFRLDVRQLIPGSYLKTIPERRRIFRDALRERLPGWREVADSPFSLLRKRTA